ncbi:MAG: phosphate signaling complex protein PhoU [Proteobacteria bacterium]|nr:phosphate signaling complex protein PhoU [Pseudomonadota bacterium]
MQPERLNELKSEIIQFSAHIERMIDKSVKGLVSRNEALLLEVVDQDEPRANRFELDIDEACTNLIAQFQPMARELRTILVVYDMNAALERMGDHAVNISKNALELIQVPPIKPFIDIPRMSELVRGMLADVLDAFINEDPQLAMEVCRRDSVIDDMRNQILRELVTFMTENPSIISHCINILRIAENLERIADLTTNIAEDTIFMLQGRVIKHHNLS